MIGKWGEIQGKLDLVRVSGEFEISEFELSGFYCITARQSRVNSAKVLKCLVQFFIRSKIRPAPWPNAAPRNF